MAMPSFIYPPPPQFPTSPSSSLPINTLTTWMRNGGFHHPQSVNVYQEHFGEYQSCCFINIKRTQTKQINISVPRPPWRSRRPQHHAMHAAICIISLGSSCLSRSHPLPPFLAVALSRANWPISSWKNKFGIKIRLVYELNNFPEIDLPRVCCLSPCGRMYHLANKDGMGVGLEMLKASRSEQRRCGWCSLF